MFGSNFFKDSFTLYTMLNILQLSLTDLPDHSAPISFKMLQLNHSFVAEHAGSGYCEISVL